jgi:hypothetical protein
MADGGWRMADGGVRRCAVAQADKRQNSPSWLINGDFIDKHTSSVVVSAQISNGKWQMAVLVLGDLDLDLPSRPAADIMQSPCDSRFAVLPNRTSANRELSVS